MVERRGTRIKGGKEREREEVAHFLLCLSFYRRGLATHSLLSISLSFSLSFFKSSPCPARAGLLPPRASRSFDPESISARVPGGTSRSQLRQLRSSSMLRLYTFSLSLSPCLSVFLSVGARSREPATGRINSHARVSVAVSVHGPLLPPSHLVPFPFSPSLLSFLLPSLLP